MRSRENKLHGEIGRRVWITILFLIIGYAIILLMSPLRLDDLTWGGDVGIERLQMGFSHYNGRYIGNLIVIALLRLPKVIRVILEILGIILLEYLAWKVVIKNKIAFFVWNIMFLVMPIQIYTQVVTWVSGYSNYMVSALFLMLNNYLILNIINNNKTYSPKYIFVYAVCACTGQLILETVTIYNCVLFFVSLFIFGVMYKKINKTIIILFVSSIFGAFIMFSNKAYYSAATGDVSDSYKQISLLDFGSTFINDIVPNWIQCNTILNLGLIILSLFLWVKNKKQVKKAGIIVGMFFLLFFIFNMIDYKWMEVIKSSKIIWAFIAVGVWLYLLLTILLTLCNQKVRLTALSIHLSQLVLMLPLSVVSPLTSRCFFHTYLMWALLTGVFAGNIICNIKNVQTKKIITQQIYTMVMVTICIFFVWNIATSILPYKIEKMRMEEIATCIENGKDYLCLPEIPYSTYYCYGANINNQNSYWIQNYKDYYQIPSNVTLEFVSYEAWKKYKRKIS